MCFYKCKFNTGTTLFLVDSSVQYESCVQVISLMNSSFEYFLKFIFHVCGLGVNSSNL